jgi:hypothetical protein
MIIYRDQRSRSDTRHLLSRLHSRVNQLGRGHGRSHEEAVEILLQMGVVETAIMDALFPDADGLDPLAGLLRDASTASGHLLWHTWYERSEQMQRWCSVLARSLDRIEEQHLPNSIEISVPEGYAYYGVYPETYLEAAQEYGQSLERSEAVCLGLRSIGSSLSAVVAAALEEVGWKVDSWTLRPRGHPFARRLNLTPELSEAFRAHRNAQFLIIDEGPGISGSSFGGTLVALKALGIPDRQIILFPSWKTDGSHLRSTVAREHWPTHRQVTTSFEKVWLQSGRLAQVFPGDLTDFSAGAWRGMLYPSRDSYPPVQPQHERRKYLLRPSASGGDVDGDPILLKFVGLGDRGPEMALRAERLADGGFTAPPLKVARGFVAMPFISGEPVSVEDTSPMLLERVAEYLCHLAAEHAAEPSSGETTLREMIRTNLTEGLGEGEFERIDRLLPQTWTERPAALDARMQPHEWLRTAHGFVKTDAVDHHDDHFLPGCQDIAWDVAGATLELELDAEARSFLVSRYQALSGDRTISRRLPHYAIAYLAFRLGYATLAEPVLGATSEDGQRFHRQAARYRRLLSGESGVTSSRYWDV